MENTTFGFYNKNSARNAPYIEINGITFYFSYSTLVGVLFDSTMYVLQNPARTTTGKHLNWLDNGNHQNRLDEKEFDAMTTLAMKLAKIKELPTINI